MATLGAAAACWLVTIHQMRGMDMGVATEPGSFAFYTGVWVSMMGAMMLPGALPAVLRHARASARVRDGLLFAACYLMVWTLAGFAV